MSMPTAVTSKGRKKVLLLHPEDKFPLPGSAGDWDLVVDFGHAPDSTYECWSREAGVRVIGLYGFAQGIGDVRRVRELLQLGAGQVVDRIGIDWWDTLSTMIWPDLLQLLLIHRLAKELSSSCDLYVSRPMPEAKALQALLGIQPVNLESRIGSVFRRLRRPFFAISRLSAAQTAQVIQDKFDREHVVRSWLARRKPGSGQPVVLLPSAYVNVTRTAISYAELLPDDNFLLIYARGVAKIKRVPANVCPASLDGYFSPPNRDEIESLSQCWSDLKGKLISAAREFETAGLAGMLEEFPAQLRWGIAVRDAWMGVFESENIAGCLSADDGNPYTLIPLILAKSRRVPALACHHGALDYTMVLKTLHADFYLANSEMEHDYLLNVCRIAGERIVIGDPVSSQAAPQRLADRPWIVLFTEPYTSPWRTDEIYGDLVRALVALCQRSGYKLVLKLHPFENAKSYRRWLRQWLPPEAANQVNVATGTASPELWRRARFAITAESTVALECNAQGIPVFLCGWLRDSYCGYIEQYAKFGVGHVLQCVEQIADIPRLLEEQIQRRPAEGGLPRAIDPTMLHNLLHGAYASRVAFKA